MAQREDFYWVYVRNQVPSVLPQMLSWCDQECEGLHNYHYVSWQVEGWFFTHESDAIQFSLAWADCIATDHVS